MKKLSIIITLAFIVSAFNFVFAAEVTLFGPKQFKREKGKPSIVTATFKALKGEGKLIIMNGNEKGTNRISSAWIKINGRRVIKPKDLNRTVDYLEVYTNFRKKNRISVKLNSKPGSYLTIKVIQ